ncbi:MAG: multiple sugar transport system permease protein [Chloroflexota bacterium]|jgi:ABC-type sugar transport system permease subunit|nr:multiple sugar transport system permease protein [Chloroflexota bacterium]
MSGPTQPRASALPEPQTGGAARSAPARKGRYSLLTRRDKVTLALMVGIPTFLCISLIWLPTVASVLLSFTNWRGIGPITGANIVGFKNYEVLFTSYALFWPAVAHNVLWLVFFVLIATPLGIFIAVLLDREMRGTRIYQSAFYIPVVLSLAVVGFIWQLQYTSQGFINSVLHRTDQANLIDWLGNPSLNIWAVLVAASWRHVGYVMVLYLAGLKSVDPTLREAASIDGANARQTFFRVVFPVMQPINVVVIVVTVIESLRAFDIVYIINKGKNGLELLSTLITNNSISEASLIGFGSAIAVVLLVISLVPIIIFLSRTMRSDTT